MNLNIANDFKIHTIKSVEEVKKLLNRLTENEYIVLRTNWQNRALEHRSKDLILTHLNEVIKSFLRKRELLENRTNVKSEVRAVFHFLRNQDTIFELCRIKSTWEESVRAYLIPCVNKINALSKECNEISNLQKKMDFVTIIDREVGILLNWWLRYNQSFILALLQVVNEERPHGVGF